MENNVNYSMKGKALIIILSVLFFNLAVFGCFMDFVHGIMDPYVNNIMGMVNAIVMLIASIMFVSFMFKGQRKSRGTLPGACLMWGLMDIVAMIVTCIIYPGAYSIKEWAIAVIMFIAFVMMMISALNRFENRVLFYISAGLGLVVQLYYTAVRVEIYMNYNLVYVVGEFITLLFIIIFFLFGAMNRTVEVEEAPEAPEAPQGRYHNGVYIPAQSVAESGRSPYAPVYSAPAPAPQVAQTASPEQMLISLKQCFDEGIITEEQYMQRREEIINEHFSK